MKKGVFPTLNRLVPTKNRILLPKAHGNENGIPYSRKVAELITLQSTKAREFFVYLANASFFLNFG